MQARMTNPAMVVPDAMQALQALGASVAKGGVPPRTLELVHLRAIQINGCSVCVDMHPRIARKAGETDERLFAARQYAEPALAALIIAIANINVWNRLNAATRQVVGSVQWNP